MLHVLLDEKKERWMHKKIRAARALLHVLLDKKKEEMHKKLVLPISSATTKKAY